MSDAGDFAEQDPRDWDPEEEALARRIVAMTLQIENDALRADAELSREVGEVGDALEAGRPLMVGLSGWDGAGRVKAYLDDLQDRCHARLKFPHLPIRPEE